MQYNKVILYININIKTVMTQGIYVQHNHTEVEIHFMRYDMITNAICQIVIQPCALPADCVPGRVRPVIISRGRRSNPAALALWLKSLNS